MCQLKSDFVKIQFTQLIAVMSMQQTLIIDLSGNNNGLIKIKPLFNGNSFPFIEHFQFTPINILGKQDSIIMEKNLDSVSLFLRIIIIY